MEERESERLSCGSADRVPQSDIRPDGGCSINSEPEVAVAPMLELRNCVYTSYYCEENVWKLCHSVREADARRLQEFTVVFISNPERKIPLWKQKAGVERSHHLVVWDYHVILIQHSPQQQWSSAARPVDEGVGSGVLVYDRDSVLPFPSPFAEYWEQAVRPDADLRPDFGRRFRLIPAALFLTTFASDRSHMRSPADGSWLQPPPLYPCIQTPESVHNLPSFISMDGDEGDSEVAAVAVFRTTIVLKSSEALREYFIGHRPETGDRIAAISRQQLVGHKDDDTGKGFPPEEQKEGETDEGL